MREAERGFDLRAHVSFADSLIEVGHEDNGRNLFDERAISGLDAVGLLAGTQFYDSWLDGPPARFRSQRRTFQEYGGQFSKGCFRLRDGRVSSS